MAMTDDDVKTRGQKELLDEITTTTASNNGEAGEEDDAKPAVVREGTMAVTAKVCVCNVCFIVGGGGEVW